MAEKVCDDSNFVCSLIDGAIGWQDATQIETDNGAARDPQIALNANGNALAVWRQSDGTRDNIRANRWIAP